MNVFSGPSGSVKVLLSRELGWLQARTNLPGRLRVSAARRSKASAASVFAGVVLLMLASCSSPGPAPGGPPGQARPASATPASTGRPAAGSVPPSATAAQPGAVPEPAHIVVVVMENHSYAEIIGNPAAPFINTLAGHSALFTRSYAITHPSQPNYLALFSGGTQGITDDSCPHQFTAPNLAADLNAAGKSFAAYAENLPGPGSPVCSAGEYARKHAPWTDFANVPGSDSLPFTSFPADFARLPTVSFVIPDLCHDMHDCSIATGDAWLRARIGGYAAWAMRHHSMLIVTWDEDDGSQGNHIVTIFAGQQVRPGRYAQPITHYSVLATIEAAYALPRDGQAATATPATSIWGS
jgi:acid phosphatase